MVTTAHSVQCRPSTPHCATSRRGSYGGGRGGGGGKHAQRLVSSLNTAAISSSDSSSTIRKLIASVPKPAALHALSHLLSLSSPLAFPVYQRIREANWFKWNPKITAAVAALLEIQGRAVDADELIYQSISMLRSPRDIAAFYSDLIDAFSERGMKDRVLEIYTQVKEIQLPGRRPFESMLKALCSMGMPKDAERMLEEEMQISGFKPSAFEFRALAQSYGELALFSDMRRVIRIMEEAGHPVDVVCANIVLSCYGDHGQLLEMVSWIRSMKGMKIDYSVRTFNTVLNSCPVIVSLVHNSRGLPLSIDKFVEMVKVRSELEVLLVRELHEAELVDEMLEWDCLEGKLDLHGFHLASVYVIMLKWMEVMKERLSGDGIVPLEISLVCGYGKHSSNVGESPVRMLVSEMMFQLRSPLRMDRRNVGRFVAKGKAVKDWLMC